MPSQIRDRILYVSDLDGTLLRRDGTLSDRSASLLNGYIRRGLLFTVATARSWNSAGPILSKLELTLPVITYNGAFLVDPRSKKLQAASVFQPDAVRDACAQFQRAGIWPLVYAMQGGMETVSYPPTRHQSDGVAFYLCSRKGDRRLRPAASVEGLFTGGVFYLTAIGTLKELGGLADAFAADRRFAVNFQRDVYRPEEFWLEVMPAGAGKGERAALVKEFAGAERLVCFGDNLNDLSLFRTADESAAPQNAAAPVKAAATHRIADCDQDAVAAFLAARYGAAKGDGGLIP